MAGITSVPFAIESAIEYAKSKGLTPKAIRLDAKSESSLIEHCNKLICARYGNTRIDKLYSFHGLRILKTKHHYTSHIYAVAADDTHFKIILHSHLVVLAGSDTINIVP